MGKEWPSLTGGMHFALAIKVDSVGNHEGWRVGLAKSSSRNWIFRPEITEPRAPAPRPVEAPLPEGGHTRDFTQTPVTLFRFSALTFNAHKIHYNREWCR